MLKKVRIALYDRDGYMPCLVDYLCKKGHQMIETRLFTNIEMLKKLAKDNEIDVLLAGEEVIDEIRGLDTVIPQIMLLSEGRQVNEQSEYFLLFKYQSAQAIVKEVLSQIAEDDRICYTHRFHSKRTVELIGVCTLYGGAEVTEYTLSMAKELARHYRTLYVNLEILHGLDYLIPMEKGCDPCSYRGMSEVIFYLKQRKEKLALKLESLIYSVDGLDAIAAVEDYRDLYHMNQQDMEHFLKVLIHQTEYERLVFDIGYLGETSLYLMSQCTHLYMPQAITEIQKSKERSFQRLLFREHCDQVVDNIQKIEISHERIAE